jgi:hypothetical protein
MTEDQLVKLKKSLLTALNMILPQVDKDLAAAFVSVEDNGLIVYIADHNHLVQDIQKMLELEVEHKPFTLPDPPQAA